MSGRPVDNSSAKKESGYPTTKGVGAGIGGNVSLSNDQHQVSPQGGFNAGAKFGNIDYGGFGNGEKKSKPKK